MTNHLEVAELMAENGNLRVAIEKLRSTLERTRPYVSELASFSNSAQRHRDLLVDVDIALDISRSYPWQQPSNN